MVNVLVIEVESHGMADEVLGTGLEPELVVDKLHGVVIKVDS